MKVHWKVDSRELTVGKDPSEINETSSLYIIILYSKTYTFKHDTMSYLKRSNTRLSL